MKIRAGFVSNSSSSSFICDACGHEEGGFDISLSDVDMVMCQNDHTLCRDCTVNQDEPCEFTVKDWKTEEEYVVRYESLDDFYENDEDENCIPSKYCPVCQFKALSKEEFILYILKKHYSGKWENALASVRKEFGENYKNFKDYIESVSS